MDITIIVLSTSRRSFVKGNYINENANKVLNKCQLMFSLAHCLLECGNYQMGRQDDVGVERIVFEMKNIRVHISISLFTVTQSTSLDPSKSQFLQLSGGKCIL